MTAIKYTYRMEEMDESPEAFFGSDGEDDAHTCAWIRDELRKGNLAAWCGAVVEAELCGFRGHASVWANSYASEADLWASVRSDLEDEARESLLLALDLTEQNLANARAALATEVSRG